MISISAFLNTLPIMGIGMGGIFLVMAVIYLIIRMLGICFSQKKRKIDH